MFAKQDAVAVGKAACVIKPPHGKSGAHFLHYFYPIRYNIFSTDNNDAEVMLSLAQRKREQTRDAIHIIERGNNRPN